MFKLGLEKAEEPEIKLPTSAGSWLRGSGAGTLGVPLEGTRRVGGILGVAGRLSGREAWTWGRKESDTTEAT